MPAGLVVPVQHPVLDGQVDDRHQCHAGGHPDPVVLEPCPVARAVGDECERRLPVAPGGCGGAHRVAQHRQDVLRPAQALRAGDVLEEGVEHLAGRERVTDPGRDPDVVLEDEELPGGRRHDVEADDMRAHGAGRLGHPRLPEPGCLVDDRGRDDPVANDLAGAVRVVDEGVDRQRTLPQPPGELGPRVCLDDPRHDVGAEGLGDVVLPGAEDEPLEDRGTLGTELTGPQLGRPEGGERVDDRPVGPGDDPAGGHHLVARGARVRRVPDRPRRHRLDPRPPTGRRGHELVDDLLEGSGAGERLALAEGRAALLQDRLHEMRDELEVARLLQLRRDEIDERPDHLSRGTGHRPLAREVLESPLEPGPGRPPPRGTQDRLVRARARGVGRELLGGVGHEPPEEPGDEGDGLERGDGVADPELQRRDVSRRAQVVVDHRLVDDHPGGDEVGEQLVVLRGGLDRGGQPGRRPPAPHERARAGVAGVLARGPERGAGGDGQQGRQVAGELVADGDRLVPVAHVDVELRAADELLPGEELVVLQHLPVARGRGHRDLRRQDERDRACCDDPDADGLGRVDEHPPSVREVRLQLVERAGHPAVGLDHAALQLLHVVAGQHRQELRGARGEPARPQVDELELFLDAEAADSVRRHGRMVGRSCFPRVSAPLPIDDRRRRRAVSRRARLRGRPGRAIHRATRRARSRTGPRVPSRNRRRARRPGSGGSAG